MADVLDLAARVTAGEMTLEQAQVAAQILATPDGPPTAPTAEGDTGAHDGEGDAGLDDAEVVAAELSAELDAYLNNL